MTSRSKALVAVFSLVGVLALGLAVTVFGIRGLARHVPGNAVLAIDLAGPIPEQAPDSPLGELLGQRVVSLLDLRDALVKASTDARIRAVRVRVGDLQAGFATAQEIRMLLDRVAKAGKSTTAYLETAGEFAPGNLQYYVASACRRVVLNPMGDINLTGLRIQTPFARGTFDKLGIDPEFPGIGDYKTARFFYTERDFTPAHREMMTWLLDSFTEQLVGGIADSRKMTPAEVRALIARAPFVADDALEARLVDRLADWSEFVEEVQKGAGKEEVSLWRYLKSGRPDRSGTTVAVVVAGGSIMRGESGYSPMPLFGGDVMGSETIARAFRQVRDSGAKAVVFRVNSPGGSAIASEVIRAEMERTAKQIPVVVSMGDVAGSGGYWITCGAQRIVADPGTITASIGVFGGHLAMEKFWADKLGVTWGRIDGTPNADMFDSLDPWTPEQRASAQRLLDRIYGSFLDRVASSRKMSRDKVDAVGRGRVFTGAQAVDKGLVDRLGGFDEALAVAKELAGLEPDAAVELVFYPRTRPFLQRLMDRDADAAARLAGVLRELDNPTGALLGPVWQPPIVVR